MKNNLIVYVFCIIIFGLLACKKENNEIGNTEFLNTPDFEQHGFFNNSSLVTATKEVPGIGSVLWKCNGQPLKYKDSLSLLLQTYSLYYEEKYNFYAIREALYFGSFKLSIGDFSSKLIGFQNPKPNPNLINVLFFRHVGDGDAWAGSWTLDVKQKNSFKITNVNYVDSTFTGTFDFHFIDNYGGNSVAPYSKNINFLDGKFTLPIPK